MNHKNEFGQYKNSNPNIIYPFGYPVIVFHDAVSVISEEGLFREREMELDGKRFQIRSFFPIEPSANPTEKLLRLIDSDRLEKKE